MSLSESPTLSSLQLVPEKTDRAVFVGQTGSGKTTLAHYLLAFRPFVVVHDGKGMINWPGYRRYTKLKDLVRVNPRDVPRIIYRPTPEEMQRPDIINGFFSWVFYRKNCTLYVDETYFVAEQSVLPVMYQACITRGRERNVEVWSATQRPFRIPIIVLSESEHWYCFKLKIRDDRKRIEGVTGLHENLLGKRLPKRWFYYVGTGEVPVGPLTLDI